jgi:hypothetical protein
VIVAGNRGNAAPRTNPTSPVLVRGVEVMGKMLTPFLAGLIKSGAVTRCTLALRPGQSPTLAVTGQVLVCPVEVGGKTS